MVLLPSEARALHPYTLLQHFPLLQLKQSPFQCFGSSAEWQRCWNHELCRWIPGGQFDQDRGCVTVKRSRQLASGADNLPPQLLAQPRGLPGAPTDDSAALEGGALFCYEGISTTCGNLAMSMGY